MSIVEWNEETEREIPEMIREGITSFKLYMTYPAMMVNDCDLYKIIKIKKFAPILSYPILSYPILFYSILLGIIIDIEGIVNIFLFYLHLIIFLNI